LGRGALFGSEFRSVASAFSIRRTRVSGEQTRIERHAGAQTQQDHAREDSANFDLAEEAAEIAVG
jgi:hypothetical protein